MTFAGPQAISPASSTLVKKCAVAGFQAEREVKQDSFKAASVVLGLFQEIEY